MEKQERCRLTLQEKQRAMEKTGGRCAHCGKKISIKEMTVEHIHPVSKGGDNSEYNITVLCEDCNTRKSNFMYRPSDYYKYIKQEYMPLYLISSLKFRNEYIKDGRNDLDFLVYDAVSYSYLPFEKFMMVHNTAKRDKKKGAELIEKVSVKVKLEYAYPGDAERILEYINKMYEKHGVNRLIYDNEYTIINAIKTGKVLMLTRANETLCGLFILDNFEGVQVENCQFNNIIESTTLRQEYIMTYCFSSVEDTRLFNDVMVDIINFLVNTKIFPVMFGYLSECYAGESQYIDIPYNYKGCDGQLQFFTIKGIRSVLREAVDNLVKAGFMTDEDASNIIEKQIYSEIGESTQEYIRLLTEKCKLNTKEMEAIGVDENGVTIGKADTEKKDMDTEKTGIRKAVEA